MSVDQAGGALRGAVVLGLYGLGVAFIGSACSSGSGTPDAGAATSSSGSTGTVCHTPPDRACTTQLDCGESRSSGVLIYSCEGGASGQCKYNHEFGPSCQLEQPTLQVQADLDQILVSAPNPPHSLFVRVLYPKGVDGTAETCAGLPAGGGAAIDDDTNTNLSFWGGFPINGTGTTSVVLNAILPLAYEGAVIQVEAFTGQIDTTSHLPKGTKIGAGCVDGQTIQPKGGSGLQLIHVAVHSS